jgi:type VI secretion system secreted protein Hcp
MAIDAYLQIDGIKGESTDEKHKDWIEVSHVVWAVHQPRAATVSTAGGHTSGRAELSNIKFEKLADIASPILLQTCAAGKTISKAVFEFMRADGDGKPIPYFRVELENVMISDLEDQVGIHEAEHPGRRARQHYWGLGPSREQDRGVGAEPCRTSTATPRNWRTPLRWTAANASAWSSTSRT